MDLWSDIYIDPDLVEQLRVLIYDYALKHADQIDYDDLRNRISPPSSEKDGNINNKSQSKCESDCLMLKRLLLSAKPAQDLNAAFKVFVEIYSYRNQHQIGSLMHRDCLPLEFYQVRPFICEGVDRNGYRLFIVRLKYYRKLPQFDVIIKNGILFLMEQFDQQYERGEFNGATMLFDVQDFDYWTNFNFDLLRFVVNVFFHYRGVIRTVLIHSFPGALGWLLRLIESWVNVVRGAKRKSIYLVNMDNIDEFVAEDQRPPFLYGTYVVSKVIPSDVVPFEIMAQKLLKEGKIDQKNIPMFLEYMKELIEISKQE